MQKVTTITLGISNLFLIRDKGTILVDTGADASKEKYLKLFADLELNPKEIELIIISHGHYDHFAHLSELKELTGAPVLCHKHAAHALQTGKNSEVIPRNQLGKEILEMLKENKPIVVKPVQPDLIMDSTFDLNQYGVSGKVIHTPGHSHCSISVILDSGEAIVGDMLVSSPFTGELCAAYFASDEDMLFSNIRNLLNSAHIFYGGHGGPFTREEVLKII